MDGTTTGYTDTSEILTGSEWRFTLGKLPYAARDVRMATVDNRVLFSGKCTKNKYQSLMDNLKGGWDLSKHYKSILNFNSETENWTKESDLLLGRSAHAVSVVKYSDYKNFCVEVQ